MPSPVHSLRVTSKSGCTGLRECPECERECVGLLDEGLELEGPSPTSLCLLDMGLELECFSPLPPLPGKAEAAMIKVERTEKSISKLIS